MSESETRAVALAGAPQAGSGEDVVLVLDDEIAVGDIDADAVGAAAEGGIAGDAAHAEGGKGSEIEAKAVAGNESDHDGFLFVEGGTGQGRASRHRRAVFGPASGRARRMRRLR